MDRLILTGPERDDKRGRFPEGIRGFRRAHAGWACRIHARVPGLLCPCYPVSDDEGFTSNQFADFVEACFSGLEPVIGQQSCKKAEVQGEAVKAEKAAAFEMREGEEDACMFGIVTWNGRGRITDDGCLSIARGKGDITSPEVGKNRLATGAEEPACCGAFKL